MVSASERDTARGPQADATEHVQGAAACTHHVAAGHSLQPKLLSSVSELREEIILNWKEINAFVFDTTTADFDCWEAINLVANHRRERVRSIPALVILASEETLNEKERWARCAFVGACTLCIRRGMHTRSVLDQNLGCPRALVAYEKLKRINAFLFGVRKRTLPHTCAHAHMQTCSQSGSHSFSVPLDRRFLEERHTLYRWQTLVQPVFANTCSTLLRRLLGDHVEVLCTLKPKA